jgi:hypothetical protein
MDESSTIEKIPAGPVLFDPMPDAEASKEVPNTEAPLPPAPKLEAEKPVPPEPPVEGAPMAAPAIPATPSSAPVAAPMVPPPSDCAPAPRPVVVVPAPAMGCACNRGAAGGVVPLGAGMAGPAGYGYGPPYTAVSAVGGLHDRYPYYSYRRPWYSPGPASVNVTILW